MSFHDRLRAARKEAGLSVNAFAKKLGVSSTAAWNWDWENTTPTTDKLPKIAEVLGTSVDWLKGEKESDSDTQSIPPKSASDTLDAILTDASGRIAALLGIKADRVKLDMKLL